MILCIKWCSKWPVWSRRSAKYISPVYSSYQWRVNICWKYLTLTVKRAFPLTQMKLTYITEAILLNIEYGLLFLHPWLMSRERMLWLFIKKEDKNVVVDTGTNTSQILTDIQAIDIISAMEIRNCLNLQNCL